MRWVLLDEVLKIEKGKAAYTAGRIPSGDFGAEVLMIEMMAQTGALLLGAESDYSRDLVFAKIQEAEFLEGYCSGDRVEIKAASENLHPEGAWINAEMTAGGRPVARANLMLMIVGHFTEGNEKPITFHEAFMNHYRVREKLS